ncbi:wd and tetratricopeptide repeat protein [Arthroderma uncinatum]|uniref:wd and tetratricopeptide repeat protein n=1 Tax=Arthroderma uncinatum TaxID=74035 RepID=UPI00144AB0AE|nr:wd and tetratricopeptide repeat protein [Arthroderma uncinatum]KAF3484151.1 wd and tetratricopeptide repeat protein [Arthroderma uncinatum]
MMKSTLHKRLLLREQGDSIPYSSVRGIYGDKAWINDLDIVNELGGHNGCVNALSWSSSGKFLASGSDDKHLNIYSYQPESTDVPFFLNTTVITGHSANIFSVKFMPHSNDGTVVSCAGDSEVRVFDIEHQGRATNVTNAAFSSARRRRINNFFSGMWYLTENNTNSRVYRSHADRVKRIVTENSPHHFLTCSEDGEVRQWDLRQPSSAYPSPRGGQGFMAFRPGLRHDDSNVPPPLISYKRYNLDLNTISCSPTQPHYIALGGAHLHCFLHDRRMLGRDLQEERGQPGSQSPPKSWHENELMGKATRCVRRFAPRGQKKMRSRDNGHITACKISNANPNEMIVSWSGEHIYSFDLIHSDDALDHKEGDDKERLNGTTSGRARKSKNRKRKRGKARSTGSVASGSRHQSRRRPESTEPEDLAFRVRYRNGEFEDIPFDSLPGSSLADTPEEVLERARESVLNEAQKLSLRIAKGLVEVRKLLFSVDASTRETAEEQPTSEPTAYTSSFTSVLGLAATYLPEMDDVIRKWRYPLNPAHGDVIFQQALRSNRESSRRFIQASGTLARVLGGKIQTASGGDSPQLRFFQRIEPAPTENGVIDNSSKFGYDFLKAILLWLEGGRPALLEGFKQSPAERRNAARFPISPSATDEAIDTILIPYLKGLAGNAPVVNVDASRFELDESRIVFTSESHAVNAFAQAIKLPLEDLSGSVASSVEDEEPSRSHSNLSALDRQAAIRFWGLKVGRGILMEVGEGVNFEFVNRAFGGLRATLEEDEDEDDGRERLQEDIDPNEEEQEISELHVLARSPSRPHDPRSEPEVASEADSEEGHDDDSSSEDLDDEYSDDDSSDYDSEDEHSRGSDDDEFGISTQLPSTRRNTVESHVPCSSHLNVYQGHCNIKTVKDVNYFGLDDEYVVSGSDDGNLFIWDRKTSDLLNILSGDSEVVNVIQGHPYEPTLAVSGIDQTIKIFSPDSRAQEDASKGVNIADPDAQSNMTVGVDHVLGEGQRNTQGVGLESRKRLHDSYQILSQNDVNRQGGMNEAFLTVRLLQPLILPRRGLSFAEWAALF